MSDAEAIAAAMVAQAIEDHRAGRIGSETSNYVRKMARMVREGSLTPNKAAVVSVLVEQAK